MFNFDRYQYLVSFVIWLGLLNPCHAEKNLGPLNNLAAEKQKKPKKENTTNQKEEKELNPTNDYVRNAQKISLPAQKTISFSDNKKQAAFLVTPPTINSLWDIKITSIGQTALVAKLRTIKFNEHNRLIDSELLLESKGIGEISIPSQLWPSKPVYLLVGNSSADKDVELSIQPQKELPSLKGTEYNNSFQAISLDPVSEKLEIPWKLTDPKLKEHTWQATLITEPNIHYQLRINGKGVNIQGQTDENNQIIIKNWLPASGETKFNIVPLDKGREKKVSRMYLSVEPIAKHQKTTELEHKRFIPLLFDQTMSGSLSHKISKGSVDKDSWLLDLTKPQSTTDGLSHISLSIYAENPFDVLTATLVQEKKQKKIIDLKQAGEINIESLSLPPAKYYLNISSTNVGVEYNIQAKSTSAPAKIAEQEPNDIKEYANPVIPRKPIKGSLSELDQKDFFVLDSSATGEAQLWRVLAVGEGVQEITVDNKYTALKRPKAKNQPLAIKQLLLLPGKHHIEVKGNTGKYTLRAIPLGPPKEGFEIEPNDGVFGPLQHLEIGKNLTGSLENIRYGNNLDQDNYRFDVKEEGHYRITITPPEDQGMHARLQFYDSTWFDADIDIDAATPLIYEGNLFAGNYILKIQNSKNESALDEYTVLLEKLDSDSSVKNDVDIEPNDRLGLSSVLTKSQTINGTLGNFDQRDIFLLPTSNEVTTIKVASDKSGREFEAQLFDSQDRGIGLKRINRNSWEVPAHEKEVYFSLQLAPSDKDSVNKTIKYELGIEMYPGALPDKSYVKGLKNLPEQLYKHTNVAWSGLGAKWEITEKNNLKPKVNEKALTSLTTLNDYVMPHGLGAGWKFNESAVFFKLKLAGDKPVKLSGIGINTRIISGISGPQYKIRRFDFLVSNDGKSFNKVLSGEVDSSHETQYFLFDTEVTASYVKLVPRQNFTGKLRPNRLKLQELLVYSASPNSMEDIDLASDKVGGHIVYHTFEGHKKFMNPLDKALIDPVADTKKRKSPQCKFPRKQSRVDWVVGFNHNRNARVDSIKYVPGINGKKRLKHFEKLEIQISDKSPLGPWQAIDSFSEQQLKDTQEIQFADNPWVKFIRFVAKGKPNTSYHCPGDIVVLEMPISDTYQSILAEWGGDTMRGPYELSLNIMETDYSPAGGSAKDTAIEIATKQLIQSSVKRERNEDWYIFNKTKDKTKNSVSIEISHPISFKPLVSVFDKNEKPLQLQIVKPKEENNSEALKTKNLPYGWTDSVYQFWPNESNSYRIRVQEATRNTIIAWDSSLSMVKQLPFIHSSIRKWSTYIQPDHEQVKILTLNGEPYPEKNWANYPYMLQAAIEMARNNEKRSDNVETALVEASKLFSSEKGSHAVVITADGVNPGDINFWTTAKQICPRFYGVGMGGGANAIIPTTDSDFAYWQDNFQDWVSACGGHYTYCDSFTCLEDFYEFAANDIRKPKPYSIELEQSYVKPADPGSISVSIGKRALKKTSKALYVILDASGSMLQKIDGKYRINIAKNTLKHIVGSSVGEHNHFALRTFGLKSKKCHHELTLPVKKLNSKSAKKAIDKIKAVSYAKTPIADSLIAAAKDLESFEGEKLIVLLTDGEETCGGDSESVLKSLRASGIDIKMYIVGFAIDDAKLVEQFKNWSSLGGGKYYDAQNESDLQNALQNAITPRFEVKNSINEVVISGYVGEKEYELSPGKYTITMPDYPEVEGKEVEVNSNKNTKAEF